MRRRGGIAVTRRTLLGLVLLAALALTAPVAAAAPQVPRRYTERAVDGAWGYNCLSFSFPPLKYEQQVLAGAAVQSSRRRRVRAGRGFYAPAPGGIAGKTSPGAGGRGPVVPPRGGRAAGGR